MRKINIEKSEVVTPLELLEYLYMLLDSQTARTIVKKFMDNIFLKVTCIFVYVNDVLAFFETKEQYHKKLRQVVGIL